MSNSASAKENWNQIAQTAGYPDEATMWYQMYTIEGRKIIEISKTLGYSTCCISRRMRLLKIDMRPRGGANNPSRIAAALFHLDQRFVRMSTPKELAQVINCSAHSVYTLMKEL